MEILSNGNLSKGVQPKVNMHSIKYKKDASTYVFANRSCVSTLLEVNVFVCLEVFRVPVESLQCSSCSSRRRRIKNKPSPKQIAGREYNGVGFLIFLIIYYYYLFFFFTAV